MATPGADQNQTAKPIFNAGTLYRTTGKYYHDHELFDEAKKAYDQAYNHTPENIDVLIGRSRLFSDSFHPRQAVKDATDALAIDPLKCDALRALADANYSMLEFEKSIALNYRGLQRRKNPNYFRTGICQGLACINDTIGENAGDVLKHYLPLIKIYADNLDEQEPVSKKHVSRIPQPKRKVTKTALEVHRQNVTSRVLAYKYLEPMAHDKFFLLDLVDDPYLKSANKQSSRKLKELADEALRDITERQDMIHAQCLYYTLKRKIKYMSQHQKEHKNKLLKSERETNTVHAEYLLRQIEICRNEHRLNDLLRKARTAQDFFDKKSNHTLPDKDTYIDRLYRCVGEGYLSQHRLSYTGTLAYNHRRVAFLMGLKTQRPTSQDSVIANCPQRYSHPKKALQNAMTALELAENANMKCWLYYEISQLLCALKNYPLSKFYAQNCQKEAQQLSSTVWWLNGCFSLICSGIMQGNVTDVQGLAVEAYEYAKRIGKSVDIQQFLLHCIDLANEVAMCDGSGDVHEREDDILHVVPKEMYQEVKWLFHKKESVPVGRRFPVLPQKQAKSKKSVRTKYLQKHLTIVPGPEKVLPHTTHTAILGKFEIL